MLVNNRCYGCGERYGNVTDTAGEDLNDFPSGQEESRGDGFGKETVVLKRKREVTSGEEEGSPMMATPS